MYQAGKWLKTHQVRHIHTTESKQLPCMVMCPVKIYIVGMEYYLECCREKDFVHFPWKTHTVEIVHAVSAVNWIRVFFLNIVRLNTRNNSSCTHACIGKTPVRGIDKYRWWTIVQLLCILISFTFCLHYVHKYVCWVESILFIHGNSPKQFEDGLNQGRVDNKNSWLINKTIITPTNAQL